MSFDFDIEAVRKLVEEVGEDVAAQLLVRRVMDSYLQVRAQWTAYAAGEVAVVPEEVVGWKALGVQERRGVLMLVSPMHTDTVWPTDDWLRARCNDLNTGTPKRNPCEESPGDLCHCGIYAARDRAQLVGLRQYGDPSALRYVETGERTVVAEVGLAGLIFPGSRGWRAARARIVRLHVPHASWRLGRRLAVTYGVPLGLINPYAPKDRSPHGHRT